MFGDLKEFVANITKMGDIHYVPVVDAGIPQRLRSVGGKQPYMPYLTGVHQNVFIQASAFNNASFTGQSFPLDVVYPDWTANETASWLDVWMNELQLATGFSGVWTSMNEVSSRCDGFCYEDQIPAKSIQ